MRSAALLAATMSCAAVACLGVALLVFLLVSRTFAPATAHIVRPLYFDYSEADATASASLLASQRATLYAHNLHEVNHKVRSHLKTTCNGQLSRPLQHLWHSDFWLKYGRPDVADARW